VSCETFKAPGVISVDLDTHLSLLQVVSLSATGSASGTGLAEFGQVHVVALQQFLKLLKRPKRQWLTGSTFQTLWFSNQSQGFKNAPGWSSHKKWKQGIPCFLERTYAQSHSASLTCLNKVLLRGERSGGKL
jgi:hypothetical protein